MDIAKTPQNSDSTIDQNGIRVFLDKKADTLLANATLDYSDLQGFMVTGMPQSSCYS